MRQRRRRPRAQHAGHWRQAQRHFAQQHDVVGFQVIGPFGLVQHPQAADGTAGVQRQEALAGDHLGLRQQRQLQLLRHHLLLRRVGLEGQRLEEGLAQPPLRQAQQFGRQPVAFPEFESPAPAVRLPAERAQQVAALC